MKEKNEERHPWMQGFTIASLLAGVAGIFMAFALMGDSQSSGTGFLVLVGAGLLIWGAIWLLQKSDGFKKWSSLSDGQKALGTLIMIPGAYVGILFVAVIAAVMGEFKRMSRD